MTVSRNIVTLSFPFVAGTALATLFHGPDPAALSAISVLVALLFVCVAGEGGRKAAGALLFFSLGCLCRMAASPLDDGSGPAFAGRIQESLRTLIDSAPWPHEGTAGLLRAVLTGGRDALSRETVAVFRASGASHILALSGLHLGIIYLIAGKMLLAFGNSRAGAIARSTVLVLLCGFYAIVTGASPSIVRAFLFICINEAAAHSPGRRKNGITVLCTALLLQLAFKPTVISSLGFQLSYLAMLGIFTLYPTLESWYPSSRRLRRDPFAWIWHSVALTLSCQVFTAPLVWFRFHTFPKYFILTNLIALPLTWAMVVCAVVTLVLLAVGLPVPLLIKLTDTLAHALVSALEIIAGM
ncbi:MAG: ComEC/Rec2 family competence protein [Bacteroidales bacterium]|nr:ComEC/Rec2 family competence protein [Bacteroidales bacterium]